VYNPAFDVTPAKLITAWVLDTGVYNKSDVESGALTALK
jgi:methylthioribose-1-phosphate isomerase